MRIDRIGAGVSAMAALTWLFWPSADWKFEPEPAYAFGIALCVWIWRELSDSKASENAQTESRSHPHDLSLARKVRSVFDEETKRFLRFHDLGVTFRAELASRLFMVADEWRGIDYEFQDSDLNREMKELIQLTQEFSKELALASGPVRNNASLLSVPTDEERAGDWFSSETLEKVSELNELATRVLGAYEKLERLMREKLPSVYGLDSN